MGGGGGGGKQTPMTTDQTSTVTQAPTFQSGSSSSVTQNKIPSWLEGPSKGMVQRADALSQRAYEGYDGQRVADFDPMMERAFDRIGNQQVAGQLGTATDLATQAGQTAARTQTYDPFEMGGFTAETAQQYMNPYTQNVLAVREREARRNADIEAQNRAAQAVRSGAFGGGRQFIMDAEAKRNTAQQLDDIQATGLQAAFEAARSQYGTEAQMREQSRQFGANIGLQGSSQALNAAQTLGQLGQTQFQQDMDITQGLGYAGDLRRQREQALLDVDYNDFLAEQRYPYEQISWLQGITAGAPHSTTSTTRSHSSGMTAPGAQTTVTNSVQTPSEAPRPSTASQAAGAITTGIGVYDAYAGSAEGGLLELGRKKKAPKKKGKNKADGLRGVALRKLQN